MTISIHAPLAGSDATGEVSSRQMKISIPAPLAGSDVVTLVNRSSHRDFNPRSPCGERPLSIEPKWS